MAHVIRPVEEKDISSLIAEASAAGTPLEIRGAGSKQSVGRPLQTGAIISTEGLTGITLYEPSELVISAWAGTPLTKIEETLADNDQALAFEPIDLGPVLGGPQGRGTIGAVFATNLSGSRRIMAGSARDHFIGVRAINGQGENFKSGGRVMKNVTGYDLCRGLSGSWGTLAVMTEVTMKVLPMVEETKTLVFSGLLDEIAINVMCTALATPYEVSGAVHLQAPFVQALSDSVLRETKQPLTALRLENFSPSVTYRGGRLKEALASFGNIEVLDNDRSTAFWEDMRVLKVLQNSTDPLWRISSAPKNGARIVGSIQAHHPKCSAIYDWSGGLIWLVMPPSSDAGASEVRRALGECGGYATLIRGDASLRAAIDVFQPLEEGVARLTKGVKNAFDPKGILNPGRMYAGV